VAMVASTLKEQQQQLDKQFKDFESNVNMKLEEMSSRIRSHIDSLVKERKEDAVKTNAWSSVKNIIGLKTS